MVDLVLQATASNPSASITRRLPATVEDSTTISVDRLTFAVSSGIDRQPSRPTSPPDASTMRGFTSTSSPWLMAAFGCSLTSIAINRIRPNWVSASPTQCSYERIVSTRSAASSARSAQRRGRQPAPPA